MAANLRRGGPLESLITAPSEGPSNNELISREADLIPNAPVEAGVVGDFRGGMRQGAMGIQAGEMFRQADFAEQDGDLEAADILRQQARNFEAQGSAYAPRVGSVFDVKSIDDAVDFAQGALGQLAPSMAATTAPAIVGGAAGALVGGPVGAAIGAAAFGAAPGYKMEAGEAASNQQADQWIRENTTADQRIREQQIKGAQGAAIELIFPTVVGGRIAKSVQRIFTKLGKEAGKEAPEILAKQAKTLKNQGRANLAQEATTEAGPGIYNALAREVGKETTVEGLTEGAQALVGQMSLSRLNPNRDTSHDVQEIIDSVVMGALGGGGISLSTSVPGALAQQYAESRKDADLSPEAIRRRDAAAARGAKVSDADLTAEATGEVPEGTAVPRQSDTELDAQAEVDSPISRLAADLGVPPEYAELSKRVMDAEKQTEEKTRDPVTGKMFNALELMDQLESEGLPRMGEEFSKRRGYTPEEWADFVKQGEMQAELMDSGIREDDLMFFDGVLSGQLDMPSQFLKEKGTQKPQSDADLERQARLRKSAFGNMIPDEFHADEEPSARSAEPEEIMQLRELRPISKNEPAGQRRYVRGQPGDVKGFLKQQVERGTIDQNTADNATVEPLGQRLKRIGATTEEMENELAGIVRDLLQRIKDNQGGDPDFVKGLLSELEALPIDVQRRGEVTKEAPVRGVEEVEKTEVRRPKKDSKQGDLFPETLKQAFPVKISEFRPNHFGQVINLKPQQGELELGKGGKGENYQQLLIRALDQYSAVLVDDSQSQARAATEKQSKDARRSVDTMTQKQRAQKGRKEIRIKLKNGQNRILDMDDLINKELERNRDEITGGQRDQGKIREAALHSALARELLREDVDGIYDRASDTVLRGSKAQDLLGDLTLDVEQTVENKQAENKARNRANEKQLREEKQRILRRDDNVDTSGQDHQIVRNMKRAALNDKAKIQREFNKAVKEAGGERSLEQRKGMIKSLQAEVKRIRDVLKTVREESKKYSYLSRVDDYKQRGISPSVAYKKAKADLVTQFGEEIAKLMMSYPQQQVAAFRADRLDALADHIKDINKVEKRDSADAGLTSSPETTAAQEKFVRTGEKLTKRIPEVQENTAEVIEGKKRKAEKKTRHAEDHTGADRALKVGEPFKGESPSKKAIMRDEAEIRNLETLIENNGNGKVVVWGALAKDTLVKAGRALKSEAVRIARFGDGERVPIAVAKADLDAFADSREIDEVTYRGLEVVMTETNSKVTKAFEAKGYRAFPQPGGVVYAPTIGFDNGTRRFSQGAARSEALPAKQLGAIKDAIRKDSHPAAMYQRFVDMGMNNVSEEWVKENHEALVDILARRELLEILPDSYLSPDKEIVDAGENGDPRPLAKLAKDLLGENWANHVQIITDITGFTDPNHYPTLDGKRYEFVEGDTSMERAVMTLLKNNAQRAQPMLALNAMAEYLPEVAKLAIEQVAGESKVKSAKMGQEYLFGEYDPTLTREELLDKPIKANKKVQAMVNEDIFGAIIRLQVRLGVISKADLKKKGVFDLTGASSYSKLPDGITLRQAMELPNWLKENSDRVDMKYEGDIGALVAEEPSINALFDQTMGFFTYTEDKVNLNAVQLRNKFHAKWVMWHELMHRGLAVKYGGEAQQILKEAAKNPTVAKIAKAIRTERELMNDRMGKTELGAVEEALAELGAALQTGNFDFIEAQYGVRVNENLRTPIQELVDKLVALMRKVFQGIAEADVELVSDAQILQILNGSYDAAMRTPIDRKKTAQAAQEREGIQYDQLKLSRGTQFDKKLQNAINQKTRKARQRKISEYLANVLGDRIKAIFDDMKSPSDSAGWFDWATATVNVALNTTDPEGVARHEAFHAWFHALGKLDGDRAIYERILKAANAPHIKKQLRALLAGNKAALDQLQNAEERAAYMFQFYAMVDKDGKRMLNIQPSIHPILAKWAKNFARVVGYVGRMESAEEIFSAFNRGELRTDSQINKMIRDQQQKRLAKDISSLLRPMEQGLKAALTTATDRLRATNNQSLTTIADLFASTVKGGGVVGYIAMRAQKEAQFNNLFNDALARHTKGMKAEEVDKMAAEAREQLQGMLPDSQLNPLAKEIRHHFRSIFSYLSDAAGGGRHAVEYIDGFEVTENGGIDREKPKWVKIKDAGPRYFPRVWSAEQIIANWPEFVDLITEESGGKMKPEDLADFRRALEAGDGLMDMGSTSPVFDAAMRAINERTFKFIGEHNAKKFAKFQEQDLTKILTTYARQAASRGEQTRHFGRDNAKIKSLLEDAKKEGATEAELKMADKAIKALEGTLGHENIKPWQKNAMMTGMTIVNLSALPLALFSSLVDPLGVAVRTGDFKQAGKTFIAGMRQIAHDIRGLDDSLSLNELAASVAMAPNESEFKKREKRYKNAQALKMAKMLGIIEQEQVLSIIGDSYNSMFANEQLQKINNRFFKIIGLDSFTKGTRIGAMVAATEYLKEYQNDKRRMEELGLKEGDLSFDKDGNIEFMPGDIGQDKARRVQAAIYRMVDESILRPTAAQRPIFMSDMRFMLLGHLKQFTFSFHNTIIRQVAKNISENIDDQEYVKAMTQVLPLLSYVPFMMAADIARAAVAGRLDDDDREIEDYIMDGIQRSGVLGVSTFGMDAIDDIAYGGAPINTFLGPVVHKSLRLAESAIDPDERFTRQAVRLLPGYAFWKGWLE